MNEEVNGNNETIKAIAESVLVLLDEAIEWIVYQLRRLWRELKRKFWEWLSKRRNRSIDRAQRKRYAALVDGKGHRESQTLSANLKGKVPMLGIGKLKRGVNHVKTAVIKKIHAKTQYLLETTSQERKVNRKLARRQRRIARLNGIREFRPFNWGLLRKWQAGVERKLLVVVQPVE